MIPALLLADYQAPGAPLCVCLHVTRADGEVLRLTSTSVPLTITGETTESGVILDGTYRPTNGLDIKSLVSTASLAVDNTELNVLPDPVNVLSLQVTSGVWDGATFVLFRCNYEAPDHGVDVLKRGTTGNVRANRQLFTLEFRGLSQAYQQMIGIAMSKTCRNRFGVNDGRRSFCPVDLADYTETVEVTAAASRLVFTLDSAQPDDWSGNGIVKFLDGDNAGQRRKVKSFVAGVVTLAEPADAPIEVGAMVEHQAGCRLREFEDCRDKYEVILWFNGEAKMTGIDHLTAPTEAPE